MHSLFQCVVAALVLPTALIAGVQTNGVPSDHVEPLNSKEYESRIQRGVLSVKEKDWNKAIHCFSDAIRIEPEKPIAYELRGDAYLASGKTEAAINDFTRVITLDPSNDQAHFNRGSAFRAEGKFTQAIDDFTASIRLNPTNYLSYSGRAESYGAINHPDQEIGDWNKVLEVQPNDVKALAKRGMAYSRTKQFDKAEQDFRVAIQMDTAQPLIYNDLAWLQATCAAERFRNGNEAVENATRACEMTNWTEPEYIDTLAAAYAEAGDFVKAVQFQEQALAKTKKTEVSRNEMEERLSLYKRKQPYRDTDSPRK